MANEREIKLKISGDSSELSAALDAAESDFEDLGKAGKSIVVLENALASVKAFEAEVAVADAKVRQLKATLSEAYDSGADSPQLKGLEKQLTAAERSAKKAEESLSKANTQIVRLNLEASKTGVSTGNLADRKAELAVQTEKVRAKMQALEQQVKSAASAEEQAAAGATRLNSAFANLNVRSVKQIETDINAVNQSLAVLARSANVSGAEFDRAYASAQKQIAKLKAELAGVDQATAKAEKSSGGLLAMVRQLGPAIGAAFIGEQFVRTNAEIENLERTFKALTGSSEAAGRELEYVRGVADRLGINAISASKAYAQLSASTKGTGVEGQATRDVFEAVARSMSVAGKSSAEAEGAFQALAQMASKGKISMEELRQQLAERLPGAMKAAADGLGITTAELNDLVESGRLTADEIFPALAKGLNSIYGAAGQAGEQTETLTQEWEHFKNAIAEAYKTIGDAGVVKALKTALESLGATVTVAETMVVSLGKTIGTFFAALANGDIGIRGFSESAKQAFQQIEDEARDKLVKAAQHNEVLAATLDENGKKALAAAKANKDNAEAVAAGGNEAVKASADWTKLNVAYANIEKSAAAALKQSEANAEARKAEAAASVAVSQAFGTEVERLNAATAAAAANSASTAEVAERKKELYAIAVANLDALQKEVAAQGGATQAQQKVIDDLVRTTEARKADADKAIAQSEASKVAAAQAQIEGQAYADNSGRLAELKAAYESTAAAAAALRAEKAAGKDVTAELAAAEIEAGKAARLYRDAIADQAEKIAALNSAKQAEINLAGLGVKLAIEQQKTIYESARARGDEYTATRALIEIKKLEIQLAELTAKAKKAEADAALLTVKAKRAELEASGQMTAAKEAELKAQELGAQAKQIEAQIAQETANRVKELTEQTITFGEVSNGAAGKADKLADSMRDVAGAAKDAAKSIDQANSSGGGGSGGGAAGGIVKREERGGPINSEQFFRAKILERGLDMDISEAAMQAVGMLYQQEVAKANKGGAIGANDYIGKMQFAEKTAIEKAIQQAQAAAIDQKQQAREQGRQQAPAVRDSVFRIEIGMGGKKTGINVASKGDADALVGVLQQLESDSARTF